MNAAGVIGEDFLIVDLRGYSWNATLGTAVANGEFEQQGRLPGAVEANRIDMWAGVGNPDVPLGPVIDGFDRTLPVFVLCLGGLRSRNAALRLENEGFTRVYDIGGINQWPYGRDLSGIGWTESGAAPSATNPLMPGPTGPIPGGAPASLPAPTIAGNVLTWGALQDPTVTYNIHVFRNATETNPAAAAASRTLTVAEATKNAGNEGGFRLPAGISPQLPNDPAALDLSTLGLAPGRYYVRIQAIVAPNTGAGISQLWPGTANSPLGAPIPFVIAGVGLPGPGFGGGDDGGGGGAAPTPPTTPTNNLTVVGGNNVVSTGTTGGLVQNSLANDTDIRVDFPRNASVAEFSGSSIRNIISDGSVLELYQDGVIVRFTAAALADVVPQGAGSVRIGLIPVTDASITRLQNSMVRDDRSANDLRRVVTITMTVDGQEVSTFNVPIEVSFNVTGRGVTAANRPSGFKVESGYNTAFFGGALEDNWLTFRTDRLGTKGIMVGADLTILRFAVDEEAYRRNGVVRQNDVAPFIYGNRTLVPIRAIAEGLGADVDWDEYARAVYKELEGQSLRLPIGELVPGLDVPARIVQNRTFVPLRYVSETLGSNVFWDGYARAVYIFRPVS